MTAGLAFEGLNHGGAEDANLLVVLNDNCMSIDPNVGALKEYLTDITTSKAYNKVKDEVWHLLGRISKFGPNAQAIAQKVESAVKSALLKQSNLFESLNFRYFGPVDGHDVEHLAQILEDIKDIPGPSCCTASPSKEKATLLLRKAAPPRGTHRGCLTRRPVKSKSSAFTAQAPEVSRRIRTQHHRAGQAGRPRGGRYPGHAIGLLVEVHAR